MHSKFNNGQAIRYLPSPHNRSVKRVGFGDKGFTPQRCSFLGRNTHLSVVCTYSFAYLI